METKYSYGILRFGQSKTYVMEGKNLTSISKIIITDLHLKPETF